MIAEKVAVRTMYNDLLLFLVHGVRFLDISSSYEVIGAGAEYIRDLAQYFNRYSADANLVA